MRAASNKPFPVWTLKPFWDRRGSPARLFCEERRTDRSVYSLASQRRPATLTVLSRLTTARIPPCYIGIAETVRRALCGCAAATHCGASRDTVLVRRTSVALLADLGELERRGQQSVRLADHGTSLRKRELGPGTGIVCICGTQYADHASAARPVDLGSRNFSRRRLPDLTLVDEGSGRPAEVGAGCSTWMGAVLGRHIGPWP